MIIKKVAETRADQANTVLNIVENSSVILFFQSFVELISFYFHHKIITEKIPKRTKFELQKCTLFTLHALFKFTSSQAIPLKKEE